jgi:hypothetical protein
MKQFFLAPTWIKQEYLRGPAPDEWFLAHKVIEIPEGMETLKVGFGAYFAAGEIWLDDAYCGPAQIDVDIAATAASDAETDRITRIQILAIPGGDVVHDTGDLGGVSSWEGAVAGLDCTRDLIVKTVTGDGKYHVARILPHPRGIH